MGIREEGNYIIVQMDKDGAENLKEDYGSTFHPRVFENILTLVKERLGSTSVLIEKEYIDKDYRNEYANLYAKMFKKFDSFSTRLHFFGLKLENTDQVKTESEENLKYQGYVIIRPIDVGKVGRSILKPWQTNPNRNYFLCKAKFTTHLLGRELTINASPFIEQDSMVMSCAQASIWMAARYMHEAFEFPEHLPYEVTESASKFFVMRRSLPAEGLTYIEIINALRDMGYHPILFSKPKRGDYETDKEYEEGRKAWKPAKAIYKYVESKIPVIALVPDHAFTIIGHTFSPSRPGSDEKAVVHFDNHYLKFEDESEIGPHYICTSDLWVDGFIVQDDQLGPYRILPVDQSDRKSFLKLGFDDLLPPSDCTYQTVEKDIESIIVPLPEKVYLLAEHIDDVVLKLFYSKFELGLKLQYGLYRMAVEKNNIFARELFKSLRVESQNPVVSRSYIMKGVDYKECLRKEPLSKEMHKLVLEKYTELHMSKFIWIVEITTASRLSKEKQDERTILGEILLDATANRYGLSFLAIHLPGILFLRDLANDKTLSEPIYLNGDRPYHHLQR